MMIKFSREVNGKEEVKWENYIVRVTKQARMLAQSVKKERRLNPITL